MGNISTKVNLGALKNAAIIMSGKNKDVECLLIPIAQNHSKVKQSKVSFTRINPAATPGTLKE